MSNNNKISRARAALKEQEIMLEQMNQEPETWTFEDEMKAQKIQQAKLKRITRQIGRNWKKKARSKKVARKTKATRNWKKLLRKARNNPAKAEFGVETIQRTNSMPNEAEPGVLDQVDKTLRRSLKSAKLFLFGEGKKKRKSNKKNKKNTKRNKNKKNKKNRKK